MATIINSSDYTFTPEEQQIIRNTANDLEVETVVAEKDQIDEDIFNIFDEDGNLLFSFDIEEDKAF